MIQMETILNVADNTGVKVVRCIQVRGTASKKYGGVGDVVVGSVRKCSPQSTLRKGAKVRGVIVRTKRDVVRKDGSVLRFDDNSIVLIDDNNQPVGNRIFGPVARELRYRNFMRIISLAPEVV
jgi:large subunit ribosomal protein L14